MPYRSSHQIRAFGNTRPFHVPRAARGDYLRGYRGDPGIFGDIFSGIKKVGGALIKGGVGKIAGPVLKSLPGVGTAIGLASAGASLFGKRTSAGPALPVPFSNKMIVPANALPGGKPLFVGGGGGGRKRINPLNVKALNRAARRQEGFLKIAKRVARNLGYQVARPKRSGGGKRCGCK